MINSLLQKCFVITCLLFTATELLALDIYLVRHFEKQSEGKDPALTPVGLERAKALAKYFESIPLVAVYSTVYRRTQQTAAPLVLHAEQGLVDYYPNELQALANTLSLNNKSALVVGHSNTTPALIKALGGPEFNIAEDEYGMLYHVTEVDGQVKMDIEFIGLEKDSAE